MSPIPATSRRLAEEPIPEEELVPRGRCRHRPRPQAFTLGRLGDRPCGGRSLPGRRAAPSAPRSEVEDLRRDRVGGARVPWSALEDPPAVEMRRRSPSRPASTSCTSNGARGQPSCCPRPWAAAVADLRPRRRRRSGRALRRRDAAGPVTRRSAERVTLYRQPRRRRRFERRRARRAGVDRGSLRHRGCGGRLSTTTATATCSLEPSAATGCCATTARVGASSTLRRRRVSPAAPSDAWSSSSAAFLDIDNDGDLDLFVCELRPVWSPDESISSSTTGSPASAAPTDRRSNYAGTDLVPLPATSGDGTFDGRLSAVSGACEVSQPGDPTCAGRQGAGRSRRSISTSDGLDRHLRLQRHRAQLPLP